MLGEEKYTVVSVVARAVICSPTLRWIEMAVSIRFREFLSF